MKIHALALAALAATMVSSAANSSQITRLEFATSHDDGGLGGHFVSLDWRRGGVFSSDFSTVFAASFGGGIEVDTRGSWDGSSAVCCLGFEKGATPLIGQTFFAPADSITDIKFLVNPLLYPYHFGRFGIFEVWPWPGMSTRLSFGPQIYQRDFYGPPVVGEFQLLDFQDLNAHLFPGREYAAVMIPIPEAPTWGLLVSGFGCLGLGLRRRRRAHAIAA